MCGVCRANGEPLSDISYGNTVARLSDKRMERGDCMKKVSLVGQKFGRLTVLSDYGVKNGRTYSECLCACGNIVIVCNKYLKSGHTKSCGCYKNELVKEMGKRTGKKNIIAAQLKAHENNTKHDMSKTRLYRIWQQMKQRCYNRNSTAYHYYGEKGISVCEEWKSDFYSFYKWAMNNGYSDNLTIDRIDSFEDYTPFNCQWITQEENTKRIHRDVRYWCIDVLNGRYIEFDNIREFCRNNPDIANENHVRYAVSGKCQNQENIIFGKF